MRSEDNTRRLFVAIPIPVLVREGILRIREVNSFQKKVVWTREPNLHITVYFIGNIRSAEILAVTRIVRDVVAEQVCFKLSFENISLAPNDKRPRMIWLRFYRNEFFTDLANRVHLSLRGFISKNPYHFLEPIPHITIARFNSTFNHSQLKLDVSLELPPIEVKYCELWESINTFQGVQYIPIEKFTLNKHS